MPVVPKNDLPRPDLEARSGVLEVVVGPEAARARGALWSVNARAHRVPTVAEADATGVEQVGDGGDGLLAVLAVSAHGEDEIAEAIVGAAGFLEWLFHGGLELEGFLGF